MSIFVSVNANDIKKAKLLERTLLKWGFNDVWLMSDVFGGVDWKNTIIHKARMAKVCILLQGENKLTFTQGVEAGTAIAENVRVIPVLLHEHYADLLPDFIRSIQFRILPNDLEDSRAVWKSMLIHDLHPHYVPAKARSDILEIGNMVIEASAMDCKPITRLPIEQINALHPKVKVAGFEKSVAIATARQQKVAVTHLTEHHTSTDFVNFLKDGTDTRFIEKFIELTSSLRSGGVSDQVILRTFVLAERAAVQMWEGLWKDAQ